MMLRDTACAPYKSATRIPLLSYGKGATGAGRRPKLDSPVLHAIAA